MSGICGTSRAEGQTGTAVVDFTPNATLADFHTVYVTGGAGTMTITGRMLNDPTATYTRSIVDATGLALDTAFNIQGPLMGVQVTGPTGTYSVYVDHVQKGSR